MSIVSIHDFYPDGNVRTDPQNLSERQKEQARQNIGAMSDQGRRQLASAISVYESGEIISACPVSSVEHEIVCKVSGAPDICKVRVSRYGKNLFDIRGKHTIFGSTYKYILSLPKNTDVTVSTDAPNIQETASTASLYVNGTDSINDGCWFNHPKTVNSGERGEVMLLVRFKTQDGDFELFTPVLKGKNYIQLEIGTQDTKFEPYKDREQYSPGPDGTVAGMSSISPSMTILTDTPGVTIEASYNADTKGYIDREIGKIQKALTGNI